MSARSVVVDGASFDLEIEQSGVSLCAGGATIEIVSATAEDLTARVDGRLVTIPYVLSGNKVAFAFDGETYEAEIVAATSRRTTRHRELSTAAPMPGQVLKIAAPVGSQVKKGEPLLILEAMKMEHTIVAPHDGIVTAVHCREGALVQPGEELVDVQAAKE